MPTLLISKPRERTTAAMTRMKLRYIKPVWVITEAAKSAPSRCFPHKSSDFNNIPSFPYSLSMSPWSIPMHSFRYLSYSSCVTLRPLSLPRYTGKKAIVEIGHILVVLPWNTGKPHHCFFGISYWPTTHTLASTGTVWFARTAYLLTFTRGIQGTA